MPKNVSINSEMTKAALSHYIPIAKKNGLFPRLATLVVSRSALSTAKSRGNISANMVSGLAQVLGADEEVLRGEKPLSSIHASAASLPENNKDVRDELTQGLAHLTNALMNNLFAQQADPALPRLCNSLIQRTIRYASTIALYQENKCKQDGNGSIEQTLLSERAAIDKAFSEITAKVVV